MPKRAAARLLDALGLLVRLACVAALAQAVPFLAAPARATSQITGGCTATSAGIALPTYDLLTRVQQTGNGTVAVQCTGTGTVTVTAALTTGTGTCATRTMKSGANILTYNIYTTAGFATVWCDPTTRVSTTFTFFSQTTPQTLTNNLTMFARAPASQNVPSGSYSDTLGTQVFWSGGNSAISNFTVTESAPATCTTSVGSLAFGNYVGASTTAQATVTATCSSTTPYTVALAAGANVTGTTRRMKAAAANFISYNLYKDAAFTAPWGDGTALGTTVSANGNGSAQTYTIYGRTVAAAAPVPGSYSDSVIVTVTY